MIFFNIICAFLFIFKGFNYLCNIVNKIASLNLNKSNNKNKNINRNNDGNNNSKKNTQIKDKKKSSIRNNGIIKFININDDTIKNNYKQKQNNNKTIKISQKIK